MKNAIKRNVVISALTAIVLCVSLIVGATFALFTSESKVNIAVSSGKVSVVASIDGLTLYSPTAINVGGEITDDTNAATDTAFYNGGTAVITENTLSLTNVVPGDKASFKIVITNESNVSVKYRTIIACTENEGLFEGLSFSINGATTVGKTAWTLLTVADEIAPLECSVELPASAGNEYQEKSCTISFTVEAIQGNAELPSEWNGSSTQAPTAQPDGKFHITTADEFVYFVKHANAGGNEYVLDRDIDLGGATITFSVGANRTFYAIFDGNGHTVSNFTVDSSSNTDGYYGGLFGYIAGGDENSASIKGLTIENATAIGGKQVGMLIGGVNANADQSSIPVIEDCHVKNCTIISTVKKAGAVVGYVSRSIVKNCTATDCVVYCADANEAGEIVGYENVGSTVTGNTATRVTVHKNTSL